jgi:predicted ATP-dependent endonuclease of OLD family
MRIIKKIEIQKFRSFGVGKKGNTIECKQLNIFSGKNNSGKSNILKALSLFFDQKTSFNENFNFEKDYNIAYSGSYGGHVREIKIKIYFLGTGKGVLKNEFYVERIFKQKSAVFDTNFYFKKNEKDKKFEVAKTGRERSQFNTFLNKINFIYIPAVRERKFIQNIFTYLQLVLDKDKKDKKNYQDAFTNITNMLTERTETLSKDFENFIKLQTSVEAPSRISDILEGISIQTDPGIKVEKKVKGEKIKQDTKINAYSSGDGIIMSYLPYFLDYLSKQFQNKKFIWGFEEPENSLEYSKIQDLSNQFLNEFSKKNQIFLTTHNPAFIFLKEIEDKVSFYRVYKEEWTDEKLSKVETETGLEKQISIFDKTDKFEKARQLEKEISFIEFSNDTEKFAIKAREQKQEYLNKKREIEEAFSQKNKVLFTEGLTDKIILKKAWKELFPSQTIDFDIIAMGGAGHLQNYIQNDFPQQTEGRTGVALFDFDTKGYEEWKSIETKKGFNQFVISGIFGQEECKKHKDKNIFATFLTVPSHLKNYVFENNNLMSISNLKLEIEHLFILDNSKVSFLKLFNNCKKERNIFEMPKKKPLQAKYKKFVNGLTKDDFKNFKPLFEKIKILFEL